jgi:hypothetical protein
MDTLTALLLSIPPMLAGGWGLWFAAGLGLSIWGRYESNRVWDRAPLEEEMPKPMAAQRHARAQATAPHSAGDAFGELQALLEEQQTGTHRMPGEATAAVPAAPAETPVLAEAPRLAAPQSLP